MQKTNFQCMYLIDQALYNKKIIKSDDVISSKFEQHTPSTHSNSASVHNLISQTPYTIKDNIGKERIYPEKIINSVEKVSDSIENPTLTTDHKDKEKCLDCASMDVDSDVTKPLENEANSMPAVKEGLSLTEDIEMIDTEPKEQNIERTEKADVEHENDEKEWDELRERLRRLREDFPEAEVNQKGNPLKRDTTKNKTNIKQDLKKRMKTVLKPTIQKKFKHGRDTKSHIVYLCSICKKKFSTLQTLKQHMNEEHSNADNIPFNTAKMLDYNFGERKEKKPKLKEASFNERSAQQKLPTENKGITEKKSDAHFIAQVTPNNSRKSESARKKNVEKKSIFLCGICEQEFVRLKSLERHIKNVHPDYYDDFDRKNKRKINEPFRSDKKFIHDGRVKRKNVNGEMDRYVKRQKPLQRKQIAYQNYFD